jgi:hypothetical protein
MTFVCYSGACSSSGSGCICNAGFSGDHCETLDVVSAASKLISRWMPFVAFGFSAALVGILYGDADVF